MFRDNVRFAIAVLVVGAGAILFDFLVDSNKDKGISTSVVSRQDEHFNHIM